jgi:Domain of Unknown Function (DUF1206)
VTGVTTAASPARTGSETSAPATEQAAEWLGTVGWAAKGIVYLLIGALAIQLAVSGSNSDATTKRGAFQALADEPAGQALLVILCIGLFAFALYQVVAIVLDDRDGRKRLQHGISSIATAIIYTVAGVQAILILLAKSSASDGNEAPKAWSARLLETGAGTALLVLVVVGLFGVAGEQLYVAVTRRFMEHIHCPGQFISRTTVERCGVAGIAARGVVAGLVALCLSVAILHHDPDEAQGLDGSLRTLQQQAFGTYLLFVVAMGLVAYGVFSLLSARCRRHVDD